MPVPGGRSLVAVVAAAGIVAAGVVIAAPSASAAPPCVAGAVIDGSQCVLPSGASVTLTLKAGNGGSGGAGGAGGAGGTGWTGAATVSGGSGGAGGPGGPGGAGAKWQGTYTNTTGSAVTLSFTIGANGADGAAGAAGTTGTSYSSGSARNGGAGRSGSGGAGGDGGGDTIVVAGVTTIATALGGDGGSGGNGGTGGQGGRSTGTTGSAGTTGSTGTTGANGAGGTESTSNAETPFITLAFPSSPSTGSTPAQTVTLSLDTNGGSCSVSSVSGGEGSWVPLPRVADCRKTGAVLAGWQPKGSTRAFAPGALVRLTDDNTVKAVWADLATVTDGSASSASDGGSTSGVMVGLVVWNATGTEVRSGSVSALAGRTPVFTIVTKSPRRVSDETISAAQRLTLKYGGVYGGVVVARTWRSPRIVAAYTYRGAS